MTDLESFTTHVVRVAKAGVRPLLTGSMGEAHHLTHSERTILITAARRALDQAGLTTVPIIAGTGAGSTRETVELSKAAALAGADYAIVIASGYYAGALAGNREALRAFWTEVAEKSPIPVIIYNCTHRRFLWTRGIADALTAFLRQILGLAAASTSTRTSSPSSRATAPTLRA